MRRQADPHTGAVTFVQIARATYRRLERRLDDLGDDAPEDLLASEQADAVAPVPSFGDSPRRR